MERKSYKIDQGDLGFSEKSFSFAVLHKSMPTSNKCNFYRQKILEISFVQPLFEAVINPIPELVYLYGNDCFEYNNLEFFRHETEICKNKLDLTEESKGLITVLISDIFVEFIKKHKNYELIIKSKLLIIAAYLLRQSNSQAAMDIEPVAKGKQLERLDHILSYIDENYKKNIKLDTVARKFYMNTSYFSDYFKKNIGVNFSDYLCKKRVYQAIHLLDDGKVSSTEAAYASGFSNITSFYNAFKKVTGMSPGEYLRCIIN